MSQARMDPANMAPSAPSRPNTGTTTGRSNAASTGARVMTPIMAIANDPMARIPSSNSLPKPNRFPKIRSSAPKTANTAITAMRISCPDIPIPPVLILLPALQMPGLNHGRLWVRNLPGDGFLFILFHGFSPFSDSSLTKKGTDMCVLPQQAVGRIPLQFISFMIN